jgi:hypothetical protein
MLHQRGTDSLIDFLCLQFKRTYLVICSVEQKSESTKSENADMRGASASGRLHLELQN